MHHTKQIQRAIIGGTMVSLLAMTSACSTFTKDDDNETTMKQQSTSTIANEKPSQDFDHVDTAQTETAEKIGDAKMTATVNFAFDSAELSPEQKKVIDFVIDNYESDYGISRESVDVTVSGYTDAIGPELYNEGLAKRRAQSVADYLQQKSTSLEPIDTQSFGEDKPIASNDTEAGRRENRRAEIVIESHDDADISYSH